MERGEWTLRSLRVLTPAGVRPADVLIRGERIGAVRGHDDPETEGIILDAGDCLVLPGLVDLRADFGSRPEGRGLEIRTRLAAAGGVTTMIDPPVDFGPEPVGPATFAAALQPLAASIWVNCGFYAPLLPAAADRVDALVDSGVFGFKARLGPSSPGDLPAANEAALRVAMPVLARSGRPLLVASGEEFGPLRALVELCRQHDCPVHLARVASAEALALVVRAIGEGLPLTAGVPASDLLPGDGPPSARDRVWDAVRSGLIAAVAPDGPPWGDSTGQPALTGLWAEAHRRGFGPCDVGRWLSGGPAALLGLAGRKGTIVTGADADFVVFDPATTSVEVEATVVRGSIVQNSGRFDGRPRGEVMLRLEETWPASGGLERLNSLDRDGAAAAFRRCCASARWAEGLAALRPFGSRSELIEAADRAWAALDRSDRLEVFAACSRIEDPGAPAEVQADLAEIAREYRRRFGFPLVFHRSGHLAPDDVDALRRRLANPPEREFILAAEQSARIARHALEPAFPLKEGGGPETAGWPGNG